jgi:hypothetical protein
MNREQLNSLMNSIHDIDNNSAKIMAYSTFSTMINDELKRVSIQLNLYQEGMNLITTFALRP